MYILSIETSGVNCSVSLSKYGQLIAFKQVNTGGFSHAENLHIFIQNLFKETNILSSDISAIAVSSGPGSYTGLRIGVATAKGLCYAWGVPLIAIPTLEILAREVVSDSGYIIPMIDARRMEVYTSVYDFNYKEQTMIESKIIDYDSFEFFLNQGKVIFLGDGSDKFQKICQHQNAEFVQNKFPSACMMPILAFDSFKKQKYEDLAYFEPIYLKFGVLS